MHSELQSSWGAAFESAARAEDLYYEGSLLSAELLPSDSQVENLFDLLDVIDPKSSRPQRSRHHSANDSAENNKSPHMLKSCHKMTKLKLKNKKNRPCQRAPESSKPKTTGPPVNLDRLNFLAQPKQDVILPSSVLASLSQPQWVSTNHVDYSHQQAKRQDARQLYDPPNSSQSRRSSRSQSPASSRGPTKSVDPTPSYSSAVDLTSSRPSSSVAASKVVPAPPAPESRPSSSSRPRSCHRFVGASAQAPRPPTREVAIGISKSLEWGKRFGDRGRRLQELQAAKSAARLSRPLASSAEELADIVRSLCSSLLQRICQLIPQAQGFASEYISLLRELGGAHDLGHIATGRDQLAQMHERVTHILKQVHELSYPDAASGRPGSAGPEESADGDAAFVELVSLCVCVPNHRPEEELVVILAWMLEDLAPEAITQTLAQYMVACDEASGAALAMVREGSQGGCDRATAPDKMDKPHLREALDGLRDFYRAHDRACDLSLCLKHHSQALHRSSLLARRSEPPAPRPRRPYSNQAFPSPSGPRPAFYPQGTARPTPSAPEATPPVSIVEVSCRQHVGLRCFQTTHCGSALAEQTPVLVLEDVRHFAQRGFVMLDSAAEPGDPAVELRRLTGAPTPIAPAPALPLDDKDVLFVSVAPALSATHKTLLALSLLADGARATVLQLSTLAKTALAGSALREEDVAQALGAAAHRVAPAPLLRRLQRWLVSNRRSDVSFRFAHPLLLDAVMQRLYALWPMLHIRVQDAACCQLKLRWVSHLEAMRALSEPEHFHPNVNSV